MAKGFWSTAFRYGLYDRLMPVNYDLSVREAFASLSPGPEDHVLDAGCGSGRLLVHACGWLRNGGRLTGIDIDPAGLAYAARRARRLGVAKRVRFLQEDLTRLSGLNLEPVDGVVTHFAIYTLPSSTSRKRALEELVGLLRGGGKLVFAGPSESYSADQIIAQADRLEAERSDIGGVRRWLRRRLVYPITRRWLGQIQSRIEAGVFHKFTESELRGLLESCGLQNVQLESCYSGCGWRATGQKG